MPPTMPHFCWPDPMIPKYMVSSSYTAIQFALRSLLLAAADILLVWGTILWMMFAIWKFYRWVAVAQIPYLACVSIATVLQPSISWSNWPA